MKNNIYKILVNKKFQKQFRKFNLFLCLVSIYFIFDSFFNLKISYQNNLSLYYLPLLVLLLNYIFGIFMWTNYMKRTYKGLSKDYLVAWLLGRLTRYIPGGFSTISTRVDQVLPQDKDHKKLLRGLIEEQFIGPFLTIITIGFLYLYGLEDLKIMEVFFIFFIVYVVFRYLFLNFVTKETSILTNPFYMFFNIFTMFLFLFIISSYFYESNSLLNTIRYQLSTSVSLLFVGVPAGLGIREFIFINFETEVLSKNLIVLYALSVRYHMIFLDFLCGISGLFLRAFKK